LHAGKARPARAGYRTSRPGCPAQARLRQSERGTAQVRRSSSGMKNQQISGARTSARKSAPRAKEGVATADDGQLRLFQKPIVVCLLLAGITLLVFWPVTKCDFTTYDD